MLSESVCVLVCRAVRRSNCFHTHQNELVNVDGGDGSLLCHVSLCQAFVFSPGDACVLV